MASIRNRHFLSAAALAIVGVSLGAAQPLAPSHAQAHLARAHELGLKLGPDHGLRMSASEQDELGMGHAHFQQYYKGIRVHDGQLITHTDKSGAPLAPTLAVQEDIHLNVTPSIGLEEALAAAHREAAPRGAYAAAPEAELVVYPVKALVHTGKGQGAGDYHYRTLRHHLAYLVTVRVEQPGQTEHGVYVVDAHTGAVLDRWNDLHTTAAIGTGHSEYSGTVSLNTNWTGATYELRDTTRGSGGTFGNNVVTDMAHGTSGNGTLYTDADDAWGDGANYGGGSTTSANGQTAAVDAAFGIQATWDMYRNALGRNGIDGTGRASFLRVHYGTGYDNAFWSDGCFCMTFGDGTSFRTLTSLDVAGHEMSHGVCANNGRGGLTYSGESGGLNESNSDAMGTMVEFYARGGGLASHAATIPATGGNWTIGEQLGASPLRWMYKPSKDGRSPDAWSAGIGGLDVHYSSGPANRAFYFMSQGSSSVAGTDTYSPYLPGGMTGVGNDHTARVHYRALTTYYTSGATYVAARIAHTSSARDLYGAGSAEERAAWNAFAAINVGPRWTTTRNFYRYYNSGNGQHFYTSNWDELALNNYGYGAEGTMGYVYPTAVAGTVPLYRYYNGGTGGHFYTTNWAELGGGRNGWGYEGVQCYVFPTQVAGTVPLYRYYNGGNGDHFYTTNWAELGSGRNGYGYEGVQCYVLSAPVN